MPEIIILCHLDIEIIYKISSLKSQNTEGSSILPASTSQLLDYSAHSRSKARHPCDQNYGRCVAQLTVTQCFSDLFCMGRLNAQHSQPHYNAHTFTMHGQINYPAHLLHPFPGASAKRSWQWPADTKTFHAPLAFAHSSPKQREGMGSWDGFIVLFQCCTGVFFFPSLFIKSYFNNAKL